MPHASTAETPEPVLKRVDAWWSVVVVDPIAVRLVGILTPHPVVTPTALTITAHTLGVAAAVLFAVDAIVAAAIVFEVRFVLDCADGKLARVRGTSSASGAYLDYVGDFLVVGTVMGALSLHLAWEEAASATLVVGLPLAFLAHIAAVRSHQLEAAHEGSEDPRPQRVPSGYRAWMAARRLRPAPSGIDVEHGLLFVVPIVASLLDAPRLLEGAAWAAAVYYAYRTLRITAGGYRIARRRDRAQAAGV